MASPTRAFTRARGRSFLATAATAFVIAALVPATPALADDGGDPVPTPDPVVSITGVVTDPAGDPAVGLCITAELFDAEATDDGGAWVPVVDFDAGIRTDDTGAYRVTDLVDGTYAVSAASCADPSDTLRTWAPTLDAPPVITDGIVTAGGIVVTHGVAASAVDIALLPAALEVVSRPVVSGSAQFGATLTADHGTWSISGVGTSYQWLSDGAPIVDATNAEYAVIAADIGTKITVAVTASRDGWEPVTATSDATATITALPISSSTPTIAGTAKVGQTLTATVGTWSPVTPTLVWLRNGEPVPGATKTTYVLTASDRGAKISVRATAVREGHATATKTSARTAVVAAGSLVTSVPKITGTVKVGSTLTATTGWTPSGVTYTYAWKRDGKAIGAAKATYTPTADDLGKKLSVTVTGTLAGYTTVTLSSASTAAVAIGTFSAPVPTVSGTVAVGRTVTAVPGAWKPAGSFTYQWKRNGVAISGATKSTYAITAADHGKTLTVTVTGKKSAYTTASKTSAAAKVAAGTLAAPVPAISGSRAVGKTLTAVPGTWKPSGVALSYQWKRNEAAIKGATKSTFVLGASDLGKTITVTVTGRKTAYATASKSSTATGKIAAGTLTAPTPTISGTRTVGKTLTAAPGIWKPSGVALNYQWKRAGTAISGATKSTYALTAADLGKSITVTVTGKKSGYTTLAKTAGGTAKIAAGTITFSAKLSGTQRAGSKLTASAASVSPGGSTVTYQWYRNGTAISGKTASTYTLANVDAGKVVSVKITVSKAGYTTKSATPKTGTVANRPASISGDGKFRVGTDVQPGIYFTSSTKTDHCSWSRIAPSSASGSFVSADDVGSGRRMIQIYPSDRSVEFQNCGSWIRYDGTGNPGSVIAGDGIFAVGTQIKAGGYVSYGNSSSSEAGGCYVESLNAPSGVFWDVTDHDVSTGTVYLTAWYGQFISTWGCKPFTRYTGDDW